MTARSFTDEVEREVVSRYKAGESAKALAREFRVSIQPILSALRRAGIEPRRSEPRLTPEQDDELIRMLCDGELTIEEAAERFGIGRTTIRKKLRARDISLPTGRPRECEVDDAAFDLPITPEKAYWVGFLFADGALTHDGYGAPTVRMGLKLSDRGHIEKFRAFLGSTHKIGTGWSKSGFGGGPSAAYGVRSQGLASALIAYGMVSVKPERRPRMGLEDSRDFWRGMVDGDGTVSTRQHRRKTIAPVIYPYVALNGQRAIGDDFVSFLHRRGLGGDINPARHDTIFVTGTAGPGLAVEIIRLLYDGATVALDRKLAAARAILARDWRSGR